MSSINWDLVSSFLSKLIEAARSAFLYLFIKKSTERAIENEALKKQALRHKKALEIAARPRSSYPELLKRMRDTK